MPVARRRFGATRRGCTQDPDGGCATKRPRYSPVGITCLIFLFCQLCICWCSCLPPFSSAHCTFCLFVCLFSEKGCGRAPSEDKGVLGVQGA